MRNCRKLALGGLLVVIVFGLGMYGAGCSGGDPVRVDGEKKLRIIHRPGGLVTPYGPGYKDFGDAVATSRHTPDGVSTVLKDPGGTTVLATLDWSLANQTVTWGTPALGTTTQDVDDADVSLTGSNYAVYLVYKNIEAALALEKGEVLAGDGCDFIPDDWETDCMRACCDMHDACWDLFGCTLLSWIPGLGSPLCKLCNAAVVGCFALCFIDEYLIDLPIIGER